jgi:hypothetical protein
MDAALHTVIRAFQADVQRALALFREHRGLDDIHSWRRHGLIRTGHLTRAHHYAFHGLGCRVHLGPDLHIDWDFGHEGRMDGFDLWRLRDFLDERPNLQQVLPLTELKRVFDDAAASGELVSPWRSSGDRLFYVAGDLPRDVRD